MPETKGTRERARFQRILRDARERSQRTVQDVAYHVAVSERTYRYWESGDVLPTLPQIRVLVEVFDDPRFTEDLQDILGLKRWYAQVAV